MSEQEKQHHDEERQPRSADRRVPEEKPHDGSASAHLRLWGALVAGGVALVAHCGGLVLREGEVVAAKATGEIGALEWLTLRAGVVAAREAQREAWASTTSPYGPANEPRYAPPTADPAGPNEPLELWRGIHRREPSTPGPRNWFLEQPGDELGSRASASAPAPTFQRPTLLG